MIQPIFTVRFTGGQVCTVYFSELGEQLILLLLLLLLLLTTDSVFINVIINL